MKDDRIDDAFGRSVGKILKVETEKLNVVEPLEIRSIEELKAWGTILLSLKDGLPLPNNPIINIKRLERIEKETGADYSKLKECCSGSNEIRDSKDLKPYFFAILDRIHKLGKLNVKVR
jgi:hypothetical protein